MLGKTSAVSKKGLVLACATPTLEFEAPALYSIAVYIETIVVDSRRTTLDNNFSPEAAHLFPVVFRRRAADALMEFDEALRELVGAGTIGARERLRDASHQMMQILARVMIETD